MLLPMSHVHGRTFMWFVSRRSIEGLSATLPTVDGATTAIVAATRATAAAPCSRRSGACRANRRGSNERFLTDGRPAGSAPYTRIGGQPNQAAVSTVGRGSRCLRNGLPRLAFLAVLHLLVGSRPPSTERSGGRGRYRPRYWGRAD